MSDEKLPRDPITPTQVDWRAKTTAPPPDEESPVELMRELRGALVNVGEKMAKLETYLMRQELAILTTEHKENTALVGVDELRRRVARVEDRLGLAAE